MAPSPDRHLALFEQGFRPFFFGAGLWAALSLGLWLGSYGGIVTLPSRFDPLTWHGHEMLFGYVMAAVAGFLLTAIPNWTKRLPVQGRSLMLLAALWLLGRLACLTSQHLGAAPAAALDLAFPLVLLLTIAREIVAGRNWRNLVMAGAVALLLLANLLVHLEALGALETAALGLRLGLATMICLIALIGGRIVPSFTRNWLVKRKSPRLPASFGHLDKLVLAATALAAGGWAFWPEAAATGILLTLAGMLNGLRLARWAGWRCRPEPLLWILHLGYLWLAAGLVLLGLSLLWDELLNSTALHALTAGAIGTMTLAVMTRATLGHSGRALTADRPTLGIYLLVTAAALLRVAAPCFGGLEASILLLSGALWIAAFGLFAIAYAPLWLAAKT